jgi:hypothetical protein
MIADSSNFTVYKSFLLVLFAVKSFAVLLHKKLVAFLLNDALHICSISIFFTYCKKNWSL